ncbi:MAG: bifunctional transcriptional activator/DNA repair enzyme AdaA [bacterium]
MTFLYIKNLSTFLKYGSYPVKTARNGSTVGEMGVIFQKLYKSMEINVAPSDYQLVEKALLYLEENAANQPSLDDVAEYIGLSPYHFQRLFKRWAGVSPKRFLQYLTVEHAKVLLRKSASVLDTAYTVGLSGPGRLHDLFISVEAVTPGEFKSRGRDIKIRYGIHSTTFGDCIAAVTDRGICDLRFINEGNRNQVLTELTESWKNASMFEDPAASKEILESVFTHQQSGKQLNIFLRGTNFQIKVWKALLEVPEGSVVSYGDLAKRIKMPDSARAVGNAVGQNPIGYLIPCHRVIKSSGELGGFRSGTARKKAILGRELARQHR